MPRHDHFRLRIKTRRQYPSPIHARHIHRAAAGRSDEALEPIAVWISGKNADGRAYLHKEESIAGRLDLHFRQRKCRSPSMRSGCGMLSLAHRAIDDRMTMHNALGSSIYLLLAPQSKYTIPFNEVMLLWDLVAPPTSLTRQYQFLEVCDEFAKGRGFFDGDPKAVLERRLARGRLYADLALGRMHRREGPAGTMGCDRNMSMPAWMRPMRTTHRSRRMSARHG